VEEIIKEFDFVKVWIKEKLEEIYNNLKLLLNLIENQNLFRSFSADVKKLNTLFNSVCQSHTNVSEVNNMRNYFEEQITNLEQVAKESADQVAKRDIEILELNRKIELNKNYLLDNK